MPIYLIGFMGSGKTTVGKKLAKELDYQFIDLDNYLETKYQTTIAQIFKTDGEAHFRKLEQQCLTELSGLGSVLISTGGGTPCFFDNMEKMKSMGFTLYLDASPALLKDRLKNAKTKRPLLSQANTEEELLALIEEKLQARLPYYKQAHLSVNAVSVNIADLAATIRRYLG